MDKWILASTNSMIQFVRDEMKAYRLYTVVPQLVKYIEQLTNWYVRLNRKRMKGSGGEQDTQVALSTLFDVVYSITRVMSPFTPYITEYFYQNLCKLLPKEEVEDCKTL
jgi:isoleucyl-tRNA synthetase